MNAILDDGKQIMVISVDRHLKPRVVFENAKLEWTPDITRDHLIDVINQLGVESAQDLQTPITTSSKFTADTSEDVIFLVLAGDERTVHEIGFIRVGSRDLYFDDGSGLREIPNCHCILDFYIRIQLCGYGKFLFDLVQNQLNLQPSILAYDRPSKAMLAFLAKHYSLVKPRWQHNHFVIFETIFTEQQQQQQHHST